MIPKISIVVPIHETMKNGDFFLWRLTQSVMKQSFRDYELVIVQEGKMAENTNAGIKKAKGELIKILYLDDYFAHRDSLKYIVDAFGDEDQWLVTGCLHQRDSETSHSPHYPEYVGDIHTGNNQIGSPSVLTVRNEGHILFDENMSYFLDCDLYRRYYDMYGLPIILDDLNVVIGIGDHQTSSLMKEEEKLAEFNYIMNKYV